MDTPEMNDTESRTPDDWIGRMAREHYNPPPPTPRDEIWAAVEARIGDATAEPSGVTPLRDRAASSGSPASERRFRGAWLALAASAILALGVGLGRWSSEAPPSSPASVPVVAASPEAGTPGRAEARGATVARMAAVETLVRSEPLLATVRAEASRGAVDSEVGDWARKILGDTRFLLDSGLPLDPQLRSLLQDLELVLMQTARVGTGEGDGPRAREELEILRQGMEDNDVLNRIQAVLPGTMGAGI